MLDIPLSAAFAAIALDEGEDAEQLPPPLPRQLARLLDCFNDMTPADRDLLLERVDWVSEWGDARIARYGEEPTRRRRRATG